MCLAHRVPASSIYASFTSWFQLRVWCSAQPLASVLRVVADTPVAAATAPLIFHKAVWYKFSSSLVIERFRWPTPPYGGIVHPATLHLSTAARAVAAQKRIFFHIVASPESIPVSFPVGTLQSVVIVLITMAVSQLWMGTLPKSCYRNDKA